MLGRWKGIQVAEGCCSASCDEACGWVRSGWEMVKLPPLLGPTMNNKDLEETYEVHVVRTFNLAKPKRLALLLMLLPYWRFLHCEGSDWWQGYDASNSCQSVCGESAGHSWKNLHSPCVSQAKRILYHPAAQASISYPEVFRVEK